VTVSIPEPFYWETQFWRGEVVLVFDLDPADGFPWVSSLTSTPSEVWWLVQSLVGSAGGFANVVTFFDGGNCDCGDVYIALSNSDYTATITLPPIYWALDESLQYGLNGVDETISMNTLDRNAIFGYGVTDLTKAKGMLGGAFSIKNERECGFE
jgi:hypothetical protein